jgi:hypothetical protein
MSKYLLNKNIAVFLFFTTLVFNIYSQVDNARFITQSVPDRMAPGQTYNLIVTFENNGTTYWSPGNYRLRIPSAGDGTISSVWSTNEMDLVKTIEPGNTASFEVKVTAPSTEGVYPFSAQLIHGSYSFGESSKPLDITVTKQVNYNEALNSSAFVEQSVPAVMEAGKSYKIMVSLTNTGKTVWTPDAYRLVMLDASGKAYTGGSWNTYSVPLSESISPGGSKVFNFDIMPILPGTYTMQWRMASSETGLFGDATSPAVVTVNKIEIKKNEGKSGNEKF